MNAIAEWPTTAHHTNQPTLYQRPTERLCPLRPLPSLFDTHHTPATQAPTKHTQSHSTLTADKQHITIPAPLPQPRPPLLLCLCTPSRPSPLVMAIPTRLSFVVALILVLSTFLLALLPVPSVAQTTSYPDRVVHGWSPINFAPSPTPSTANLLYVIDGQQSLVVVDARDGCVVRSVSFAAAAFQLFEIAVDSRGYVFVTAYRLHSWRGPWADGCWCSTAT